MVFTTSLVAGVLASSLALQSGALPTGQQQAALAYASEQPHMSLRGQKANYAVCPSKSSCIHHLVADKLTFLHPYRTKIRGTITLASSLR